MSSNTALPLCLTGSQFNSFSLTCNHSHFPCGISICMYVSFGVPVSSLRILTKAICAQHSHVLRNSCHSICISRIHYWSYTLWVPWKLVWHYLKKKWSPYHQLQRMWFSRQVFNFCISPTERCYCYMFLVCCCFILCTWEFGMLTRSSNLSKWDS